VIYNDCDKQIYLLVSIFRVLFSPAFMPILSSKEHIAIIDVAQRLSFANRVFHDIIIQP